MATDLRRPWVTWMVLAGAVMMFSTQGVTYLLRTTTLCLRCFLKLLAITYKIKEISRGSILS